MHMLPLYRAIPIQSCIFPVHVPFFLHNEAIPPDLLQSVSEYGIQHPPLVQATQAREGENFQVLSGKKRLAIAQKLHLKEIVCQVLPKDIPAREKYITLIYHEHLGNTPSPIKQAWLLKQAEEDLSQEEVISLLPLMGYPAQARKKKELAALLHGDEICVAAIHEKRISPKAGSALQVLPETTRFLLMELIDKLRLGQSKQNKLIEYSVLLEKRSSASPGAFAQIIRDWEEAHHPDPNNIPQIGAALFALLQRAAYPHLTDAETRFQARVHGLDLPHNSRVEAQKNFEDESVCLQIQYKDMDQLEKSWQQIKDHISVCVRRY